MPIIIMLILGVQSSHILVLTTSWANTKIISLSRIQYKRYFSVVYFMLMLILGSLIILA